MRAMAGVVRRLRTGGNRFITSQTGWIPRARSTSKIRPRLTKKKRELLAIVVVVVIGTFVLWRGTSMRSTSSQVIIPPSKPHAANPQDSVSLMKEGVAIELHLDPHSSSNNPNGGSNSNSFGDSRSLGPHEVVVRFLPSCQHPNLWIRIEGDALVTINLSEKSSTVWIGRFSFPIEGVFDLVAYWYGCGNLSSSSKQQSFHVRSFNATDTGGYPRHLLSSTTTKTVPYPASVWISSQRFTTFSTQTTQPYVWHDPNVPPKSASLIAVGTTMLSKEGTIGKDEFYGFSDLSNYELVCWIGSESAASLRNAFLELRPLLFSHQRPFKFHLYSTEHFVKPDREWNDETKKRLRKCKHVLVSLDELSEEPLSRTEYSRQVTDFLNHLEKVIIDESFPIWMFTMLESPTQATHCHNDDVDVRKRTSHHPCNDALVELFQHSPFPDRVKLLDATDVSLPQLFHENRQDLFAAVAIRIYVFVGKKVQEWRDVGQVGTVNGLKRGGKTEPNFELIPYTGWN